MKLYSAIASVAIVMFLAVTGVNGQKTEPAKDVGRCYASPKDAMNAPAEKLAYVVCTYAGTERDKPDYLAMIDVDPKSKTYSQVVHRVKMPNVGDELHHFGWNACGSCFGQRERRYLIIPGLVSGRIHMVDTADPRAPKLHKVIEPKEVIEKTKLTSPHTVHCLSDGRIMISMLGNENGDGPGGFLLLDDEFDVDGSWAADNAGMKYNYDFWYQPRHNVMVSSEWAHRTRFGRASSWKTSRPASTASSCSSGIGRSERSRKTVDLGERGMIPLEVRFHHDPESTHGFVGAALSSTMWHLAQGRRQVEGGEGH